MALSKDRLDKIIRGFVAKLKMKSLLKKLSCLVPMLMQNQKSIATLIWQ